MELKLNRKNDSDVFSLHEGDVPFLSFRALDDTGIFMNAFSTRFGGVSEGYLASMNLTLSKEGEKPEHVAENFRCMAEACGFDDSRKKLSFQGHTVNVRAIGNADLLIVGGTSLTVYPAAGLIDYYDGDRLVLINRSVTPLDSRADLLIQGSIGEIFSQL